MTLHTEQSDGNSLVGAIKGAVAAVVTEAATAAAEVVENTCMLCSSPMPALNFEGNGVTAELQELAAQHEMPEAGESLRFPVPDMEALEGQVAMARESMEGPRLVVSLPDGPMAVPISGPFVDQLQERQEERREEENCQVEQSRTARQPEEAPATSYSFEALTAPQQPAALAA